MGAMASQITSLTIVYSTVYSGGDQRKYESSASLAFVRGIHQWIPRTKASNAAKASIDDVIMSKQGTDLDWLLWRQDSFAKDFCSNVNRYQLEGNLENF